MAQVTRSPKQYDVCIIGSGAGGGVAAKVLTEGGLNCAMLEAGPDVHPEKDFKMFMWPYDLSHRGAGVGGHASQDFSEFLAPNGAWHIQGEPYTSAPGNDFQWFRSRIVGGRTNHWGRIALRFAPIDFKSKTRDGLGDDWPISYDDLSPYYDKVESYIGVFGTKENVSSAPDGVFLPPPKPRCTELLVKKACDKLNIICIPSRLAILTKSINGRLPCHYCGQCGRGCVTGSNFSSSQVLIPPAMKTGKLTLITGAMAREILVDNDGKANAVSYIEFGGGRDMPGIGMFNGMNREQEGYGLTLKQRARKEYGCHIGFAGRGEMIPNPDTYCEIDPEVVDEWGIPVLRFHFKWSDYELLQAKDMQETFKAIVETMGGEYKTHTSIRGDLPFGIEPGGKIIHEVGTARMGADPKTSVLNGFCQAHDVKNLFVTDGAPLVTNPDKNPTLTIMALSWRASEYLLDEARKGNI